MNRTIGRNDPCWCGSGRKFKHCHLKDGYKKAPADGPPVLNAGEQESMRCAGRFNAQVLDYIRPFMQPGAVAGELDRLIHEYTVSHGHTPATLGYKGYTKSCCISINEVICHGIPEDQVLKEGDIVNVDVTSIVDGWYGDSSETFLIGNVSKEARRLVQATFDAMYLGIEAIRPGATLLEMAEAINRRAEEDGFSVVREFQGHGLGRRFHELPHVPHHPTPEASLTVLEPGICFTVEPMINAGGWRAVVDQSDGWTARTLDGSLSAQFEHTVLVTEDGHEILTLTQDGPKPGHRF